MQRREDIFAQVVKHVAVRDLFVIALTSVLWIFGLGIGDGWGFLVMTVLRVGAWVMLARTTFPRMQGSLDGLSDAQLREIDTKFGDFRRRFPLGYAALWGIGLAGVSVYGVLKLASTAAAGYAEILLVSALALAVAVGNTVLVRPHLERVLLNAQQRVITVLHARGAAWARPPGSMVSQLVSINVTLLLMATSTLIILGSSVHVGDARELALEQQRRVAEQAASDLRRGVALSEGTELRIADADALASIFGAGPPRYLGAEGETLVALDAWAGRAIAAAPDGQGRWVVAEGSPDEDLGWIALGLLVFATLIVTRGSGTIRVLVRDQLAPIVEVDATMRELIESGNMLGRARVLTPLDDEAGSLATTFNEVLDTLDELGGAAEAVAEGDLRARLDRPGDLFDAFRAMQTRLEEVVGGIHLAAVELSATSAELQAATAAQEQVIATQSRRMRTISHSVGELASGAEDISVAASRVLGDAERSVETSTETSARITELGRETGSIGELLDQIREIADRSDILALNGSLEATRAGEAGRGFALVATEMRRLAERVSGIVDGVRGPLAAIERAGASTVEATGAGRSLAQRTAETAREISAVTQRQSEQTRETSEAAQEAAEGLGSTAAALAQTKAAAEGLRLQAAELEVLTRQFTLAAFAAQDGAESQYRLS